LNPGPIEAPRISAEAFVTPPISPQPTAGAKRRWPVVVLLLVLLLTAAGAAAWIFAFGGRALLGV